MNVQVIGLVAAVCLTVPAAGQSMDWCTYLGGSGEDRVAPGVGSAILVDAQGRTYAVGRTYSLAFPTTDGAFDRQLDGARDAFAARLSGDGTMLEWSTFLGGSDIEAAIGATLDGQGRIVVVGGTSSFDFPVTGGAYDTTHNGNADVFVAILDPDEQGGNQLVYCTFLGGAGVDAAYGAFYDASGAGAIVVVGQTQSADFPVTSGAYDTTYNGGDRDMFVARFDPTLSTLEASTFVGGSGDDSPKHVHVGPAGIVTISGPTKSPDIPTSPGAFDDTFDAGPDERDCYVAQLDQDLAQLLYGTYVGGSADEAANAMDVEASGAIVLAGFTSSADFPVTDGAYDTSHNGGDWDTFVTRLDPAAIGEAQLVASTFYGGSNGEGANGMTVDVVSGAVTIAGSVSGSGLPTTPDAIQPDFNGGSWDSFVARLDWGLEELLYATYLGGSDWDAGLALAGDVASRLTIAGGTVSSNFPVTNGTYDESWNGDEDVFILRIDLCPADVDESGAVNVFDLLEVLAAWGQSGVSADINGDGLVNVFDLLEVLAAWGPCP